MVEYSPQRQQYTSRIMPRVFLPVSDIRQDISSAAEYGEVYHLVHSVKTLDLGLISRQMDEALKHWNYTEDDFVCLAGPLIPTAVMLQRAGRLSPKVRVLVFCANKSVYVPSEINNV